MDIIDDDDSDVVRLGDDDATAVEAGGKTAFVPSTAKIYDFVYDGPGERLDVYLTRVQ